MKGKCVHKEQCLSYPALLTCADLRVPISNAGVCCESYFTLHTYKVTLIEGKDVGHRYTHMTTVQFVFNNS